VLLEKIQPQSVSAYLSGLLIGREIREGLDMLNDVTGDSSDEAVSSGITDKTISIIGEPLLCQRYTDALSTRNRT